MNHPSDYMRDYRESSSDDESNHQISLQIRHTVYTNSHKKHASTSMVHPSFKNTKKPKKKSKTTSQKAKNQHEKQKHKKQKQSDTDFLIIGDAFYGCNSIEQISNRLIHRQAQKIMREERLRRKQRQCVRKIQKYLRTFVLKIKQKPILRRQQKVQLYNLLKEQQQGLTEDHHIQKLLRSVLSTLQKRAETLIEMHPTKKHQIDRWKNSKMHQLMTVQTLLLNEQMLAIDIFDLEKQLRFLNEEIFFPELKEEAIILEQQIKDHINLTTTNKQTDRHDDAVKWVMNRLFEFISQRPMQWEQIARKIEDYHQNYRNQPILSDRLFIEFERQEIGTAQVEEDLQQQSYLHIFNKAVFDLINQTANKAQRLFPSLECLKDVFVAAEGELGQEEYQPWNEDMVLWVQQLIYQQLLDDALQDFLDFY